jgi:hypothetical protein
MFNLNYEIVRKFLKVADKTEILLKVACNQINIEILLFGNDTCYDQTNSKMFEKVLFFFIKQTKRF